MASATFEAIRKKCLSSGKLFEDPDFPADDSILRVPNVPPEGCKWLRPHEICKPLGLDPKFILDGSSRFDLKQGIIGDCWVLVAAASVSCRPDLLQQVVPSNQNFDRNWYAGIFRFRFWRYGKWIDVHVDDRLPTSHGQLVSVHSNSKNEFWSALLEKAYAKIHKSYQAITSGNNADSLTDFTGGLVESFQLKKPPANLDKILSKAVLWGSVMSAGIEGDPTKNPVMPNGLATGHAYSVTGYTELKKANDGKKVCLVRIRNPWGSEKEWNGPWSDKSPEWNNLSAKDKTEMGLTKAADGEFWMSLSDFMRNFTSLEICNLSADGLRDAIKKWVVSVANSQWIQGRSAGGCLGSDAFYKNPQFYIKIQDGADDADNMASLVVEVMQCNRRVQGLENLAIGFEVYSFKTGDQLPLNRDHLYRHRPVASGAYAYQRSMSARFELTPGEYVIIPTTYHPDEESEFVLRVFSETNHLFKQISLPN